MYKKVHDIVHSSQNIKRMQMAIINKINKFWCNQLFNRVSRSNPNKELQNRESSWINLTEKIVFNKVNNSLRNLNISILCI